MEYHEDASTHSVTYWLAAAKTGDPAAGQILFERYFERLVSLSHRRVPRKQRVEDGEDAAIMAMHSVTAKVSSSCLFVRPRANHS